MISSLQLKNKKKNPKKTKALKLLSSLVHTYTHMPLYSYKTRTTACHGSTVGWQGEEYSFTALTKIKHEDSVVYCAAGKTNIIFFMSKRSLGTDCIKRRND